MRMKEKEMGIYNVKRSAHKPILEGVSSVVAPTQMWNQPFILDFCADLCNLPIHLTLLMFKWKKVMLGSRRV